MTKEAKQGENFLKAWLTKCGCDLPLERLVYYTVGIKEIDQYARDDISDRAHIGDNQENIKYFIKYFKFPELYIAVPWGGAPATYNISKACLSGLPDNFDGIKELTQKRGEKIYAFKLQEKSGLEFIKKYLLKDQ